MTDRDVVINGEIYKFVKAPHETCQDCDIFKDSKISHPHQYPLCYMYNTRGKETQSQRGLIVNLCARHPSRLWKKVEL